MESVLLLTRPEEWVPARACGVIHTELPSLSWGLVCFCLAFAFLALLLERLCDTYFPRIRKSKLGQWSSFVCLWGTWEWNRLFIPLFVNNAVESTQGLGLGSSANTFMFSSDGNLVLTRICSPNCFKQQLVDYQKFRQVLLSNWFHDLMWTFRGIKERCRNWLSLLTCWYLWHLSN